MTLFRPLVLSGLLLAHLYANATSFDCQHGRSPAERMICGDSALSALDDTLGQLYWKARRRVAQRRAFIDDSNSKWAWREANCRDVACLRTWYATRIDELQRLLASLPKAARHPASAGGDVKAHPDPSTLQCTAAKPGLVVNEQCASVIEQSGQRWRFQPRDDDWFCGVATLETADMAPSQEQAPMQRPMQPQMQASVGQ
ncbi:lysozyme inhibitor LprI family protein [Paraburkholderia sp. EG304]|uniref:lysozyme inhibitor LprI family protein n=1 Tax=Paraburkholderia sp. EG304 TaxID=3237015 RepID=UPI00397BA10B